MRRSPLALLAPALLAPALLAPVLLAGCSSAEPGSAAATSGAAETAEAADGPTRYVTLAELTAALTEQSLVDETSSYGFTTTGPQTATGSGVARVDAAGQASRTESQVDAGGELVDVEVVVIDQEIFIELPAGAEAEPGRPWVRVDPDGTDPVSLAFGAVADQLLASSSPVKQLEETEDAYTLTGVTEEQRDGETVLRYAVDVDLVVLSERLAEGGGEPLPVAPGQTSTGSYLVDADDRLLETVSTTTVEGQTIETVTTFSGWGEPVEIAAPPADLVASTG